jgi:hypothetical protein
MLQKHEGRQTTETTMATVEMEVVEPKRRRTRKRKVKTRIESLDPGMIRSGFATAEPIRQNSPPKNAVLVTLAIVVMTYENI